VRVGSVYRRRVTFRFRRRPNIGMGGWCKSMIPECERRLGNSRHAATPARRFAAIRADHSIKLHLGRLPRLRATLARLPEHPTRHRIELRQQGRIAGLGRGDERHVEGAVGADGAGGVLTGEGAGEPLDQAVRLVHVL
jgi:hypothetical protein